MRWIDTLTGSYNNLNTPLSLSASNEHHSPFSSKVVWSHISNIYHLLNLIGSTYATVSSLNNYATKNDLNDYAKTNDLDNYVKQTAYDKHTHSTAVALNNHRGIVIDDLETKTIDEKSVSYISSTSHLTDYTTSTPK